MEDIGWWYPFRPWAVQREDGVMSVRLALLEDRPSAVAPATKKAKPVRAPSPPPPEDNDDDDDDDDNDDNEGEAPRAATAAKPRKVPNTPKGRADHYFRMWGGGTRTSLQKRMVEELEMTPYQAKGAVGALSVWLGLTWFQDKFEDPTVDEVIERVLIKDESFPDWRKVLRYQEPEPVVRKPAVRKPKAAEAEVQHGSYKLLFAIRPGNRSLVAMNRMGTGVRDWDPNQPIAFLTNLSRHEDKVSSILREEAVQYLGIDPNNLRIIVPPMFNAVAMRGKSALGNPISQHEGILSRTGLDLVLFEATSNDFKPNPSGIGFTEEKVTLQFLPLEYQEERKGRWFELSVDTLVEQLRGHIFPFVTGNRKVGRVGIAILRPRNVPQHRVALAFYYRADLKHTLPELVGVYVFPLQPDQPTHSAEDVPFTKLTPYEEVVQAPDDPIVAEASSSTEY